MKEYKAAGEDSMERAREGVGIRAGPGRERLRA